MKLPRFRMKKIRKNLETGKKTGFLCFFLRLAYNSQQIFYIIWFSGVHRLPWVTWCIKIRIPEKTGFQTFPDFFRNGFYALFCDNKMFFFFRNTYFQSHSGDFTFWRKILKFPWRICESPRRTWGRAREERMSASYYKKVGLVDLSTHGGKIWIRSSSPALPR